MSEANLEQVTTEESTLVTEQETTTEETTTESDASSEETTTEETTTESDASSEETTEEAADEPPEAYADFALPEGMELDAQLLETAVPVFKELGLTQVQAQKLVDFQAAQVQAGETAANDARIAMVDGWKQETINDKELGGDNFDENISKARVALKTFGSDGLTELLDSSGVGNHPEIVRFMVKVGGMLGEDVPGGNAAAPSKKKDRVSTLYPNDT